MKELNALKQFEKLGFFCVTPTDKDKTFFFTKHIEKGNHTVQIWVILRKTPIVEYRYDGKQVELPATIESAIGELLGELDYPTFVVA